jgi:hypothetical protein
MFVASQAVVWWECLTWQRFGAADVDLYAWWVQRGLDFGEWPGLNQEWVYPVGALAPMVLAAVGLLGQAGFDTYLQLWMVEVTALNAVCCVVAVRLVGLRRAAPALMWWMGFLGLLGPAGMTRLDSIIMPLVIMALLVASVRPWLAAVLLTVGAWIKVVPGLVLAVVVVTVKRWWQAVVAGAAVCVLVVAGVLAAGGSLGNLFSFVAAERGRGLQVESVLATPVVLANAVKGQPVGYWNSELSTVETWGTGADVCLAVGNIGLPVAAAVIVALAWLGRKHGIDTLLVAAQTLAAAMICFNKVGSPQFAAWLAPAVLVALAFRRDRFLWWPMAVLVALTGALTWLLYPTGYNRFLGGEPGLLVIFTLRNALVVFILAASATTLVRLVKASWHPPAPATGPAEPRIELTAA